MNLLNKSLIFIFIQILTSQFHLQAQKSKLSVCPDRLYPADSAAITGYIGQKLDASYRNRILAQDINRLVEPFHNRTEDHCWQSEFWGKWFTSAVLAYRYHSDPRLKILLDQAVSKLLSTQTPDGYIGNYANDNHLEQWDIWGRKYCMLGLLAYYDLTNDKSSLSAACRMADHLMRELTDNKLSIVKMGNHRGMAATSILEPICLLYSRTGDQRYLAFANEIVSQWESPNGPQLISKAAIPVAHRFPKPENWFGWEQGQKAYEMMSCYEGLLELYRLTGKPEYREAVEKTWQNIYDTEINITGSGSAMECWFGGQSLQTIPVEHYQETCVTATWIKLSQQLLRLTGEAKYADAIEQSWYNALIGAMFKDGADWAKYSPLAGQRLQGSEQCGMGLNCCVASGPRGLFTLPLTSVMSDKEGIQVIFFEKGTFKLKTPEGKTIVLTQETDYPVSGDISLKIALPKEELMKISIRIPQWSQWSSLRVNGQVFKDVKAGKYTTISRVWKSGDVLQLSLDMRGRIVHMGNHPESIAIIRGPIVLARDTRLGSTNVNETIQPIPDKDGFLELVPSGNNCGDIWMSFSGKFMQESHREEGNKPVNIILCDYGSAGNTLDASSWFRVWFPQAFDPRK